MADRSTRVDFWIFDFFIIIIFAFFVVVAVLFFFLHSYKGVLASTRQITTILNGEMKSYH